jgi:bifunctional non-homologous end joining protein LigD
LVSCGDDGIPAFHLLRRRDYERHAFVYAFDLLLLDGEDLRREPIERRKALLEKLLANSEIGIRLNEHLQLDGELVFEHACRLGLEGIVSKRLGSRYRSGRSPDWLKSKNPDSPAVKREAEIKWR